MKRGWIVGLPVSDPLRILQFSTNWGSAGGLVKHNMAPFSISQRTCGSEKAAFLLQYLLWGIHELTMMENGWEEKVFSEKTLETVQYFCEDKIFDVGSVSPAKSAQLSSHSHSKIAFYGYGKDQSILKTTEELQMSELPWLSEALCDIIMITSAHSISPQYKYRKFPEYFRPFVRRGKFMYKVLLSWTLGCASYVKYMLKGHLCLCHLKSR